jgi:Fe-S cluster biogenesis protein NfuA
MAPLKDRVQQILRQEVAPALLLDGSGIEVLDVTDGVARVRIGAACASCPASLMTVIMGLEQELRQRVPEIEYLEAAP